MLTVLPVIHIEAVDRTMRSAGRAASVGKIVEIRGGLAQGDPLALASGVTPENIAQYAPYVTHVLVSTGISRPSGDFCPVKLAALMKAAL